MASSMPGPTVLLEDAGGAEEHRRSAEARTATTGWGPAAQSVNAVLVSGTFNRGW